MGQVFSPLDEELGLMGGALTPRLAEAVVYVGSLVPFRQAVEVLRRLCGVEVSESLVRQLTERAGAVAEAQERARAGQLVRGRPVAASCEGPAQQVSVDGAMVPLVGGEWAEVKTAVIGELALSGEELRAVHLSYFSRLSDADEFIELAGVEVERRKTEEAREVVAVADGADWEQRFFDEHCPTATRVLDWGHCAGHLGSAAQAVFGAGTKEGTAWLEEQLTTLRTGEPAELLAALGRLQSGDLSEEARQELARVRQYLAKRVDQITYAVFRQRHLPIGSGIVESGNKVVVEARLKGPGMHWTREHVNQLLAHRSALCSDRWDDHWSVVRTDLCRRHRPRLLPELPPSAAPSPPTSVPVPSPPRSPTIVNGRPTPEHPWKRRPAVTPRRAKI